MIALRFSGHFQCRLPTDPDPTDEPRGVSGFMWAVAGEPDLDRIVRFQKPVAPRLDKPPIGVEVRTVFVNGTSAPQHPLIGASVELLDNACYEGRNGIVARSGSEPIVPFKIQVSSGPIVIIRDSGVADTPFVELQPKGLLRSSPGVIGAATGVWNFRAVMDARAKALAEKRDALPQTKENETARAALASRLANIAETQRFAAALHDSRVLYGFAMTGLASVTDDANRLEPQLDTTRDWQIEFWMGGWDIDAMSGFVAGWLIIPHREGPGAIAERSFADKLGEIQPLEFVELDDEK